MAERSAAVRVARTADLDHETLAALRALFAAAWPDDHPDGAFDDHDWAHTIGGQHVIVEEAGAPIAHASVVTRELHVDGQPLRTGYVEAVATRPDREGRGHATAVMRVAAGIITAGFELGALATGIPGFYERLGWEVWRGPTFVRTATGLVRSPDEDGAILVLRTPTTPPLDLDAPISCESRPGEAW